MYILHIYVYICIEDFQHILLVFELWVHRGYLKKSGYLVQPFRSMGTCLYVQTDKRNRNRDFYGYIYILYLGILLTHSKLTCMQHVRCIIKNVCL